MKADELIHHLAEMDPNKTVTFGHTVIEVLEALAREKADKTDVPPQYLTERASDAAKAALVQMEQARDIWKREAESMATGKAEALARSDETYALIATRRAELLDELGADHDKSWYWLRGEVAQLVAATKERDSLRAELETTRARIGALEEAVTDGEAARIERNAAWAELEKTKANLAALHKAAEQDRATAQTATADLAEVRRERNQREVQVERYRVATEELRHIFRSPRNVLNDSDSVLDILDRAEGKESKE